MSWTYLKYIILFQVLEATTKKMGCRLANLLIVLLYLKEVGQFFMLIILSQLPYELSQTLLNQLEMVKIIYPY